MAADRLAITIALTAADLASKDIEFVQTRVRELAEEIDRTKSEFTRSSESVESFGLAIQSLTQDMAEAAKGSLMMAAAFGTVITALAGLAYKSAVDAESSLIDLAKVLEGGREEADQYSAALAEMAVQYAQNSNELTGAMANFVQAGYDAQEAFMLVEESTKLMIAGDMEATEAAGLLISTLKGFGAPAEEAAHAVDVISAVSNKYATNAKELAVGMAGLSPVAKQLGFTLDETAGLLTPVIEVYRSGSEAADALKVGLLKLTDSADPVIEALEDIGVKQRDLSDNLRSGKEIFLDVARAFQTLSETEKLDLTARLVGLEQAGRMSTVLSDLGKVLKVTETAANGTGSAIAEVSVKLQSAQSQINRTKEQFGQLATTLGNQFKQEISGVVAATGALAGAFDRAVQSGSFEPLLNTIRPQVEAIASLLTAMSGKVEEALTGLDWSVMVLAISEVSEKLGQAFQALTAGFDLTTVEGLRNLFQSLISIFASVVRNIGGIVDGIQPLMSSLNAVFKLMTIGDGTISRLTGQMEGLSLSANQIAPAITAFSSSVLGAIGSVIELIIKITILISVLKFLSGIGALSFLASLAAWFVTLKLRVINFIMILAGFSGAIGTVGLIVAGLVVGLGYLLAKLTDVGTQALYAKTGIDLFGTAAAKVEAQRSAEAVAKLNAQLKEISDTTGVTVKNMIELDEALLRGELIYDELTNTYSKGNMELRRQQAEAKAAAASHDFLAARTKEEDAQLQALIETYKAQGMEYDARTGAIKKAAAASQTIVTAIQQENNASQTSISAMRQLAAERAQSITKSDALVAAEQRLTTATEQYQRAKLAMLQDQSLSTVFERDTARANMNGAAFSEMGDQLLALKTDLAVAHAEFERLAKAEGVYSQIIAANNGVLELRDGMLKRVNKTTSDAAISQERLSNAIKKAAVTDAEAYASKLGELRAKTREVINVADAEAVRRRTLAIELRQSLDGIEADIVAQKKRSLSQIQREYEAHIGRLNAAARSHLEEVKKIEEQIAALKLSTEDRLRALAQQGMTDQERYQDQQRQIAEKGAAARAALLAGEFDKAAKFYEEQANLAERAARRVMDGDKEIVSEKKAVQTAYKQVADAMKGQEQALQAAADSHKARADAANQALEQTKQSAESVADSLESLNSGNDTTSKHTVESNVDDVLSDIDKLDGHDTSSTHTIYVEKVERNAAGGYIEPQRFASGGRVPNFPIPRWSTVPGVGNTDSVPAALAPGSFVLKKAAARYYGPSLLDLIQRFATGGRVPSLLMPGERLFQPHTVSRFGAGFFDALNQMRLPRDEILAALGNMTAPVARFATGGAVGALPAPVAASSTAMARDVVDINLQIGDRRVQLSGARDQAKALAGALRELQRRV